MLTPNGNANRRCERVWLNGDEIGVRFLKDRPGQPPPRRAFAEPARG
jgi:hypothetical protein